MQSSTLLAETTTGAKAGVIGSILFWMVITCEIASRAVGRVDCQCFSTARYHQLKVGTIIGLFVLSLEVRIERLELPKLCCRTYAEHLIRTYEGIE